MYVCMHACLHVRTYVPTYIYIYIYVCMLQKIKGGLLKICVLWSHASTSYGCSGGTDTGKLHGIAPDPMGPIRYDNTSKNNTHKQQQHIISWWRKNVCLKGASEMRVRGSKWPLPLFGSLLLPLPFPREGRNVHISNCYSAIVINEICIWHKIPKQCLR